MAGSAFVQAQDPQTTRSDPRRGFEAPVLDGARGRAPASFLRISPSTWLLQDTPYKCTLT